MLENQQGSLADMKTACRTHPTEIFTIEAADVDGDEQAGELLVYFYLFYRQSIHSSTSVCL